MVDDATHEVVILHETDFSGRSILYGWNPETDQTRMIYDANGSLDGGAATGIIDGEAYSPCPKIGAALICVHAGPSLPPEIVRIDLMTGQSRILAAPNAVTAAKHFLPTQILSWHDAEGHPANGVLVLPDQHHSRLPLVITSYRCRGFLRGGIGWVVPEDLLAQRGIAALCVNNNNALYDERDAQGRAIPMGLHKAAVASYATIIHQLAEQGVIDPALVGVAGHSFSDMVIGYAISHTDLFRAVVMGTGFALDPASFYMTAPTADSWRRSIATLNGFPLPNDDPEHLWQTLSPALNIAKIHAAVLMQPPENEWLYGLQLFAGLQYGGGASDMFIYPDEGHSTSQQPSHQYWRYLRSLDWFGFWLQDKEYRTSETSAQYDYWEHLRAARGGAQPAGVIASKPK